MKRILLTLTLAAIALPLSAQEFDNATFLDATDLAALKTNPASAFVAEGCKSQDFLKDMQALQSQLTPSVMSDIASYCLQISQNAPQFVWPEPVAQPADPFAEEAM